MVIVTTCGGKPLACSERAHVRTVAQGPRTRRTHVSIMLYGPKQRIDTYARRPLCNQTNRQVFDFTPFFAQLPDKHAGTFRRRPRNVVGDRLSPLAGLQRCRHQHHRRPMTRPSGLRPSRLVDGSKSTMRTVDLECIFGCATSPSSSKRWSSPCTLQFLSDAGTTAPPPRASTGGTPGN